MNLLKRLAGQTAVYGLSTLLVRLINYALAPIHTRVFSEQSDYGVITLMFAYAAFLNVLLMYGMETAFFRFATKEPEQKDRVFRTSSTMILISTSILVTLLLIFAGPIATLIHTQHIEYVRLLALIIGLDTVVNIPFAGLRLDGKPFRYLMVKMLNVCTNLGLNLFFLSPALLYNPEVFKSLGYVYQPSSGVYYVFLANFIASLVTFLVFIPSFLKSGFGIDPEMRKKLWAYGSPLIIVGFAGMVNEVIDRLMLKAFLPGSDLQVERQIGIYSACYKLAIFMNLMVQAFRMGAEPFFFKHADRDDSRSVYADVLLYFSIFTLFVYVAVIAYLDPLSAIIGKDYRSGLFIVPALLIAYFFLGVFYNLSTWYKVTDNTRYATYISLFGACFTIISTYIFIPLTGILAGALGTVVGYGSMCIMSYFVGQRIYPIPYKVTRISAYFLFALLLSAISYCLIREADMETYLKYILNSGLIIAFLAAAWIFDLKKVLRSI